MGKQSEEGKGSDSNSNSNSNIGNGNRAACAACRYQRRKCKEDCVLSPYFPTNKTQEYEAIHRVFGYSNISKMLTNLDDQARKEAIKSFEWEAMMWRQDPVYGPLGAYHKACNTITQLWNLCQQQQQQQQMVPTNSEPNLIMAQAQQQDPLLFPINVNWAPQEETATNVNVVQDHLGMLNCVPLPVSGPNALLQQSSMLQPNYLQSMTSTVARPDHVVLPSAMDQVQQGQVREFQFYNENKSNIIIEQLGMKREGHGADGNVGNNVYNDGQVQGRGIYGQQQGHGGGNSVIQGNIVDHTLPQNGVRSQVTEFQIYYPVGHTRIKREE